MLYMTKILRRTGLDHHTTDGDDLCSRTVGCICIITVELARYIV